MENKMKQTENNQKKGNALNSIVKKVQNAVYVKKEKTSETASAVPKQEKQPTQPKENTNIPGKIKTGVDGLDIMLKGGFIKGRTILVSGPAGSGKSTLAMQFAYKGANEFNQPALYVTLEEPIVKIKQNMSQFGFNVMNSENFHIIGGPIGDLTLGMKKSSASFRNLISEIEEVVEQNKIKRVVIDSVNLFMMLMHTEEEQRLALAQLSNRLSKLGCTTILVSETKEGTMDLSRHGIEEFVVDGVIVLYVKRKGPTFIPGIAVRKMRGINHEKGIKFVTISNKGIEVHPQETMFSDV